jgi:hypothetical protein
MPKKYEENVFDQVQKIIKLQDDDAGKRAQEEGFSQIFNKHFIQ